MSFVLPAPHRTADLTMHDGAVVRLRQHGVVGGPRIAVSHGNGLATDGYFPFWRLLADRFELVIFDVRNHGRNPLHPIAGHVWPNFVRDLGAVRRGIDEAFGARPTVGAFHSLSAVASLAQAVEEGSPWSALALFDPPLCPPPGHPLEELHQRDMAEMSSRARRRPERYRSVGAFAGQLRAGRDFQDWVEGAHRLMAEATLRRDAAAGDFVLACPREYEAQVFETNLDPTLWTRARNVAVPLMIVGADPAHPATRGPAHMARAAAAEGGLRYHCVVGTSHFLQIERPEECAAVLADFLAAFAAAARRSAAR